MTVQNDNKNINRYTTFSDRKNCTSLLLLIMLLSITILFTGCIPTDNILKPPSVIEENNQKLFYSNYSGPVMPLTILEDSTGITARRKVNFDFEEKHNDLPYNFYGYATVTDSYILSNETDKDIIATAIYPFRSNYYGILNSPQLTVNGIDTVAIAHPGPYDGGFSDMIDTDYINSFEELESCVIERNYWKSAFDALPESKIPVIVYQFSTNKHGGTLQTKIVDVMIKFHADDNKSTVFTCNLDTSFIEDDKGVWSCVKRCFFVSEPQQDKLQEDWLLVVMGEDIAEFEVQCLDTEGVVIPELEVSFHRYESTLDEVLIRTICKETDIPDEAAPLLSKLTLELMMDCGPLSDTCVGRYSDGRLDSLISDTIRFSRITYLEFPVTIPAGGKASVEITKIVESNCDYASNMFEGYDLATGLGSNISFTEQTVTFNLYRVRLQSHNLDFNPDAGVYFVELDINEPYYWMHILRQID